MIVATVLADSISPSGQRLTTFELIYPRFIHSEFMTHRIFNRNASSSRAIPTKRLLEQIKLVPAMPIHWGKNQSGMQAHEQLDEDAIPVVKTMWNAAASSAVIYAESMLRSRLHKQVVNRILEPFMHIKVVCTSTQWDNFFGLRIHEDAQPEIRELAEKMKEALDKAVSRKLVPGQWHLPYITAKDAADAITLLKYRRITRDEPSDEEVNSILLKVSAARCARASYNNFEGRPSSIGEDMELFADLVESQPVHASPTEHQATPMQPYGLIGHNDDDVKFINKPTDPLTWEQGVTHMDKHQKLYSGNLQGWVQFRKLIPNEFIG